MNVYVAAKFHADYSNRELIEKISQALDSSGHHSIVAFRDLDEWGAKKLSPHEIMVWDFKAIRGADVLLVEFSEKGVGIGIAIGFAKALGKRIIVIAKKNSETSDTVQGTADSVRFYDSVEDLPSLLSTL